MEIDWQGWQWKMALDEGTSEGVKKSWETRKRGGARQTDTGRPRRSWTTKDRHIALHETEEEARRVSKEIFGEEHSQKPDSVTYQPKDAYQDKPPGWIVWNEDGTKALSVPRAIR